jgi:hypothetical protein
LGLDYWQGRELLFTSTDCGACAASCLVSDEVSLPECKADETSSSPLSSISAKI